MIFVIGKKACCLGYIIKSYKFCGIQFISGNVPFLHCFSTAHGICYISQNFYGESFSQILPSSSNIDFNGVTTISSSVARPIPGMSTSVPLCDLPAIVGSLENQMENDDPEGMKNRNVCALHITVK